MESLPVELVEKIFANLEAKDLANCAEVNSLWRNIANANRFWKPLCVEQFGVDPNSKAVIEAESVVEPRFEIPANLSERLTDVCEWRIRYAQEVHITRNFTEGRYVKKNYNDALPEGLVNTGLFLVAEKLISISYRKLEIWNFEGGLTHEDTTETGLPYPIARFFPLKNGFSYLQHNMIVHYSLKNGKFGLKLKTAIEKPLIDIKMPNLVQDNIEQFSGSLPPFNYDDPSCQITSNDRYLVVGRMGYDEILFIFWDLKLLQSSAFRFPCETYCEDMYMGFSEGESSKIFVSPFYPSDETIVADTIYSLDIQNLGKFEKTVVDPFCKRYICTIDDFIVIGYGDRIVYVRGEKCLAIECDPSGNLFEERVLKTNSFIVALGRFGDNLSLLVVDLDLNFVGRIEIQKPAETLLYYSLHTIGEDFVAVGSLFRGPGEEGPLVDLKRLRSYELPLNALACASRTNRAITTDIVRQCFYYFY